MKKRLFSILVFGFVVVLSSCGIDKVRAASYAVELDACAEQNATCEGYVRCRKRVAEKFGRRYNAKCE